MQLFTANYLHEREILWRGDEIKFVREMGFWLIISGLLVNKMRIYCNLYFKTKGFSCETFEIENNVYISKLLRKFHEKPVIFYTV